MDDRDLGQELPKCASSGGKSKGSSASSHIVRGEHEAISRFTLGVVAA
jgi:hypothetical protein